MTAIEINVYPPGNQLVITGTIVDGSGNPYDPPQAVFHVTDPDGIQSTYIFGVDSEVTNPAVGEYLLTLFVPYLNSAGGDWFYGLQALDDEDRSISFARSLFQISKTGTL